MAASKTLGKRKIDTENRIFNTTWTDDYFFVLPTRPNARPVCLICTETVSVVKVANIKRHYDSKHADYDTNYPRKSALRTSRIAALTASYQSSTSMIVKTGTVQANATEASLRIVWVLAKHKKSYMDAEVVKECMVAASEVLYEDKKLVDMVKQIPLSDSTATRRSDDLAENIFDQLINDIKLAQVFALACDESTDKTDIAQLCVYVRFFNGTGFREELLALLPLHGQTRGEDIFKVLSDFLTENGLDVTKIVSLTTDGAPAMTGRERGLVGRLKLIQPHLISYHCITHQSVLCS